MMSDFEELVKLGVRWTKLKDIVETWWKEKQDFLGKCQYDEFDYVAGEVQILKMVSELIERLESEE